MSDSPTLMKEPPNYTDLSPQEHQVLQLSISGLADKEVAARLGLSIDTVKTYWKRIRQKSRGRTRPEIVAYFLQRECREQLQANRVEITHLLEEVQRSRKSESLARSTAEEKLNALCEANSEMVAILRVAAPEDGGDAEFRIEHANSHLATFLKRSTHYLFGRRLRETFPEAMAQSLSRYLAEAMSSGKSVEAKIGSSENSSLSRFVRIRVIPISGGAVLVASLNES